MARQAKVRSIDAVRAFRAELLRFTESLVQIQQQLLHECHRGVEWIESDRMAYWPAQMRRASDRLSEARISLERCQAAVRPDDRAPCTEEKKSLERAQQRLRLCESKIQSTREWLRVVRREADAFRTALAKGNYAAEVELPQALARMDEIIAHLEAYL